MIPHIGIELEYMIVQDEGNISPIADDLLRLQAGETTGEVEVGDYCWSNELVLHVIEFKTAGPVATLEGVAEGFQQQVRLANKKLSSSGAILMPTAMHPWMDPLAETRLWPHDNGEVYAAFDRVFGCRGHGWSNLQSMHLNFPFRNDEEFGRLHAAIRLLLPILPALAASSPIVEGRATGMLDNRIDFYRTNCANIPSVTGDIIPEAVFTPAEYQESILERIYCDLQPYDPDGILQDEWVNARGAIARFVRNTIEIRLLDVQECPTADIAIAALVWATIEALMEECWCSYEQQKTWSMQRLKKILLDTVAAGDEAMIHDADYLACFGIRKESTLAGQLWRDISSEVLSAVYRRLGGKSFHALARALERGPLSRRILRRLGDNWNPTELRDIYLKLAENLSFGEPFY